MFNFFNGGTIKPKFKISKNFVILSYLKNTSVHIRFYCRIQPRAHVHLRVRRLRSQIPRGVTEGLTDRVDTDERTGVQEVLASNITRTLGVHLRPLRVRVIG